MDQRVEKTKRALRDALFALLEEKKIDELTVTELCQKAGINRRTFYIHYETIEDIFEEYQANLYLAVTKSLESTAGHPEAFVETLDMLLRENFTGFRLLCLNDAHHLLVEQLESLLFLSLNDALNPQENAEKSLRLTYLSAGMIASYVLWFRKEGEVHYEAVKKVNAEMMKIIVSY